MKNLLLYSLILLGACCCTNSARLTNSPLDPANFRTTVNGKTTDLYKLNNSNGLEVYITNYGARIVSIIVPDRHGNLKDVVLGYDSIEKYIHSNDNFGALIGRYANRIDQGRFTLNDSVYQLERNNNGHCLHGGSRGFQHSVWDVENADDTTIVLSLHSPDRDEGFPGNVTVKVTYSLSGDNALNIEYCATTDKPTIINLSNHSYFNLSGNHSNDILSELLYINADGFTPVDSTLMTDGTIANVDGTPFDFRSAKPIGENINDENNQLDFGKGYDHNFILNTDGNLTDVAAFVFDSSSGIKMELFTDEPGIQLYTGNMLDESIVGKGNIAYPRFSALCLESQHFPNSPNIPHWPSVVLNPDSVYHSKCSYRFSVCK